MDEDKESFTVSEVASITGLSEKTITRWAKAGKISPVPRDYRGWKIFNRLHIDEILRKTKELKYAEIKSEAAHNHEL